MDKNYKAVKLATEILISNGEVVTTLSIVTVLNMIENLFELSFDKQECLIELKRRFNVE